MPVGQAGRTTITQAGLMLRFVRNTFSGSHVVFDELPDCPVKRRLGAFSAFVLGEEVDVGTARRERPQVVGCVIQPFLRPIFSRPRVQAQPEVSLLVALIEKLPYLLTQDFLAIGFSQ